jgi:hypothetical protein
MSDPYNSPARGRCTLGRMKTPDLFVNVHKGLRRALFETIAALGRGEPSARELLATTLRFLEHHGANEDTIMIPLVREKDAALAQRMAHAHELLTPRLEALKLALKDAPLDELFTLANRFLAAYLEHMHEEETVFDPLVRAALTAEELVTFGQRSVQRTAPADQLMMLGWMLPAMPRDEANRFLERVPADTAASLRRQFGL